MGRFACFDWRNEKGKKLKYLIGTGHARLPVKGAAFE